jgi:hypothetical protein
MATFFGEEKSDQAGRKSLTVGQPAVERLAGVALSGDKRGQSGFNGKAVTPAVFETCAGVGRLLSGFKSLGPVASPHGAIV